MRSIPGRQAPLAFDYIRACLSRGHSIARRLLDSVRFEQGQLMISLPVGVPISAMLDFRAGGRLKPDLRGAFSLETAHGHALTAVPRPSTDNRLAGFIAAYLQPHSNRICVFDDVISHPTDPLLRSNRRIVLFREEVYRVMRQSDMARPFILQNIRDADALWYFMCIGAPAPASTNFAAGRRFSAADLDWLAGKCDWLAVGAYDGEGYVMWRRGAKATTKNRRRR